MVSDSVSEFINNYWPYLACGTGGLIIAGVIHKFNSLKDKIDRNSGLSSSNDRELHEMFDAVDSKVDKLSKKVKIKKDSDKRYFSSNDERVSKLEESNEGLRASFYDFIISKREQPNKEFESLDILAEKINPEAENKRKKDLEEESDDGSIERFYHDKHHDVRDDYDRLLKGVKNLMEDLVMKESISVKKDYSCCAVCADHDVALEIRNELIPRGVVYYSSQEPLMMDVHGEVLVSCMGTHGFNSRGLDSYDIVNIVKEYANNNGLEATPRDKEDWVNDYDEFRLILTVKDSDSEEENEVDRSEE